MSNPLRKWYTHFSIITLLLFLTIGCSTRAHPVSAPWETQIHSAYEAARSREQDVVLTYMHATSRHWPREEKAPPTFFCRWEFLSPSTGKAIVVFFEDSDISGTIETYTRDTEAIEFLYSHPLTEPEQERLRHAAQAIKVSPTEAYQKATQDGLFFGDKLSFAGIQLSMQPIVQDHLGIPAVWRVSFANETATQEATIWIDPTTGAIVGHTDSMTVPTAEPQSPRPAQ